MDKSSLNKQFALRLRDAMLKAGFNSHRSVSGVDVEKLAEITGYSIQICRKYLRGDATPDNVKLIEIAKKLNVSPGWLLFGESNFDSQSNPNKLSISKKLLQYILTEAQALYNASANRTDLPDFILELIADIGQINATEEQSIKIIDLAVASAKHFGQANGTDDVRSRNNRNSNT